MPSYVTSRVDEIWQKRHYLQMVYAKVLRYKIQLDINEHCYPDRPDVARISHHILLPVDLQRINL